MTGEPKTTRLTPDQARKKWGELLHARTRTYSYFPDGDGEWRPELQGGELAGYRWHKLHKTGKTRWRNRRTLARNR